MGLSKEILLTVKDYEVKLNKDIKFYENDTIDLCFSILEYGIEVKNGMAVNKLMPINALKAYMLIETPQGVDYAESTKVENNRVVFNLGNKYSQFIGIGKMQIVIKDSDGCRITLPEFPFEIRQSINSNWDRDITVLSTEENQIIIDEFGRRIELKKISEMEETNILPTNSYSMILDNNKNKKIKTNLITQKIENDLQLVNEQLDNNTQQINGIETNMNSIKLIAHRGLSSLAPENTLPAYELAGKYGYWGAEADVLETSDGYYVLMHDNTVDRTTDGTGVVSELTLEQIKNLTVDIGANISNYPNLKVPTMEEYLQVCKKYNLTPIIEIKVIANVDNFLEILKKYNVLHSCVIISYDWDLLWKIRVKNSFIKMQGVSDTFDKAKVDRAISYKIDVTPHYSQGRIKELVDYAHSKGINVGNWTVDTEDIYEECKNAGVDYIITNVLKDFNNARQVIGDYSILNTNNTMSYILNVIYNSIKNMGILIKNTNLILGLHSGYLNKPFENQWAVSTNRARGQNFNIDGAKKFRIEFDANKYSMTVHCYNVNNYFIKDKGWLNVGEYDFEPNTYFAFMYFKKNDNSNITESDMLDIIQSSKLTLLY